MRTLGLDLSSASTGWAVLDGLVLIDSGILDFASVPSKKEKLLLFQGMLTTVLNKYKPFDYIIIEDTFFSKNILTLKTLSKYSGVAIVTCFQHSPTSVIALIPVAALRSTLFPKQKVDKEYVYKYICDRYKLTNVKNDVTDAIVAGSFPHYRKVEAKWVQ
jgi:Holliday junction resolvasome RuvABC endonuclease subunit